MRILVSRYVSAFRAGALLVALALAAPLQALQGTVRDAASGAAVEGAYVTAGTASVTTAGDGAFEFDAAGDSVTVSHVGYLAQRLPVGDERLQVWLVPAVIPAGEIVVSGLRDAALREAAASATVFDQRRLGAADNHHFQDLASGIPNLNWAGGTSRPRYFQIRGVGERSQFAGAGAPNYSVGFLMDDVDLSGLGSAGVLFDLDQLEVFKGSQSTVFGPNSMAGQINVRSADPDDEFGEAVQLTVGSDALQRLSGAVNVPLAESLSARVGMLSARSNGFRENRFLDIEDSNRRRENLWRAKLLYADGTGVRVKGTLFFANLDNGYDAWAPDNNEELVTYSDRPGQDKQETLGGSIRAELLLSGLGTLISITSYSHTDQIYSYDGDWGNDQFWGQDRYGVEGWSYDYFDETDRERTTVAQELRLLNDDVAGGSAAAGLFYKDLEEKDRANGYLFSGSASALNSTFDITDLAVYGQYGRSLRPRLSVTFNGRADRYDIAYRGQTDAGPDPIVLDAQEWLLGGKVALVYGATSTASVYGALSRGYRPGGINQHPYLAAINRPFDPEFMTTLEVGGHWSTARSTTALTLFHARRSQQQVSLSRQQDPGDPNSFFYFTANAAEGSGKGLELEHRHRPLPNLALRGTLGLLSTHIDRYSFPTEEGTLVQGDRAAAHAPGYNLALSARYDHPSGLSGRLKLTAADGFFYSDSHDQRSGAHQLLGGSLSYQRGDWRATLWGRNLLDERYGVRGFFFGLEPPSYAPTLYESYGDPRQWGISLSTSI